MNITRTLNIIAVEAICYDTENKCEVSKILTFIGHYSDSELEKKVRNHPDVGILIDWTKLSEKEDLYGMPVEKFYLNSEIIKKEKEN
jgi:hypothetical protein